MRQTNSHHQATDEMQESIVFLQRSRESNWCVSIDNAKRVWISSSHALMAESVGSESSEEGWKRTLLLGSLFAGWYIANVLFNMQVPFSSRQLLSYALSRHTVITRASCQSTHVRSRAPAFK